MRSEALSVLSTCTNAFCKVATNRSVSSLCAGRSVPKNCLAAVLRALISALMTHHGRRSLEPHLGESVVITLEAPRGLSLPPAPSSLSLFFLLSLPLPLPHPIQSSACGSAEDIRDPSAAQTLSPKSKYLFHPIA